MCVVYYTRIMCRVLYRNGANICVVYYIKFLKLFSIWVLTFGFIGLIMVSESEVNEMTDLELRDLIQVTSDEVYYDESEVIDYDD